MINSWLEPQIEYLLLIQNFREATNGVLDNFFLFITSFGEITIPMIVVAIIYWCINSSFGMFILWNWGLGLVFNELIKSTACIYRPWILDSRVHPIPKAFNMAGGYSFPSGHSQTAVAVWGSIAYCFKNKFLTLFCLLLILLVGFSRNYAGVHTPQDVLFAFLFAIFVLFAVKKIMEWVEKGEKRDIFLFVSVILFAVFVLVFESVKAYPLDFYNGELIVNPERMRLFSFPKTGVMLGVFTGWFLNKRFLGFDGSLGTAKEKLLRASFGLIFLLLLSAFGLKIFGLFLPEKCAMLCTSFTAPLYVIYLYPLILHLIQKRQKN